MYNEIKKAIGLTYRTLKIHEKYKVMIIMITQVIWHDASRSQWQECAL